LPASLATRLDDHHLLLPDRAGNRRLDGLLNILAHPKVALIFLIPGVGEELRVNGSATIHDDPELCAGFAVNGRLPLTVTRIRVDQAFLQCGRAAMRAGLWRPSTWPAERPVPSLLDMVRDHACDIDVPVKSQEEIEDIYGRTLY